MKKELSWIKRVFKYLTKVGVGFLSNIIFLGSNLVNAVDIELASQLVGTESAKAAVNKALKIDRQKRALSIPAIITYLACTLVSGAAASLSLCIACGILLAKVIG